MWRSFMLTYPYGGMEGVAGTGRWVGIYPNSMTLIDEAIPLTRGNMNPISKAIAEAKFSIPLEILQQAFAPISAFGRPTALNLDAVIREKVIDARVRVDCDLVGGTQMDIPLRGVQPEQVSLPSGSPYTWALIYRIPMTLTQNRIITRVMWVANTLAPISGAYSAASYNGSALANAAMGVMQSQAPIPSTSSARVDLINTNTVMISDTNQWPFDATLRVFVENDKDMSLLPVGAYRHFAKLCGLAIRAHIYNSLVLRVNSAELQNGQELGRFKEIMDGYADSNELYLTYIDEVWREVAAYADPISARDWSRLPLGAGI
jgi:hypothetical protein